MGWAPFPKPSPSSGAPPGGGSDAHFDIRHEPRHPFRSLVRFLGPPAGPVPVLPPSQGGGSGAGAGGLGRVKDTVSDVRLTPPGGMAPHPSLRRVRFSDRLEQYWPFNLSRTMPTGRLPSPRRRSFMRTHRNTYLSLLPLTLLCGACTITIGPYDDTGETAPQKTSILPAPKNGPVDEAPLDEAQQARLEEAERYTATRIYKGAKSSTRSNSPRAMSSISSIVTRSPRSPMSFRRCPLRRKTWYCLRGWSSG
jgi:hypothetical protein